MHNLITAAEARQVGIADDAGVGVNRPQQRRIEKRAGTAIAAQGQQALNPTGCPGNPCQRSLTCSAPSASACATRR